MPRISDKQKQELRLLLDNMVGKEIFGITFTKEMSDQIFNDSKKIKVLDQNWCIDLEGTIHYHIIERYGVQLIKNLKP